MTRKPVLLRIGIRTRKGSAVTLAAGMILALAGCLGLTGCARQKPVLDFALKDSTGATVKLSDYRGKNVIMVFYPLDWSPVCTNEHACFVNDMKSFDTLDAEVLGISVDSVWSHKAYADKMGIKYSLLADFHPKGAVSEKYGTYLADKGITGRAIAIVNKQGKIAWFKNYDIPVVPDVKEVASALGQVKAATA